MELEKSFSLFLNRLIQKAEISVATYDLKESFIIAKKVSVVYLRSYYSVYPDILSKIRFCVKRDQHGCSWKRVLECILNRLIQKGEISVATYASKELDITAKKVSVVYLLTYYN